MGGNGAKSSLRSNSKGYEQKHFGQRNIKISDRFYESDVDSKRRSEYMEGLEELSKDFDMFKTTELNVEIEKMKSTWIGYSTSGKLAINEDVITGKSSYSKGNGSLAWHSAHELAHQIQDRIIERAMIKGEYANVSKFHGDRKNGSVTIKKILVDANKKANKIEGVNKTVYDRLQSISSYANPKNKYTGSTWREGHSEAIGKYIQSHRSSSDTFGRLVYEETLRRYNNG